MAMELELAMLRAQLANASEAQYDVLGEVVRQKIEEIEAAIKAEVSNE